MARHPGAAHRRRPHGGSKIVRWACPCCGTEIQISRANLTRLFLAAKEYHGTNKLGVDISELPAADWTAWVSDEVIHQAVLVMSPLEED